MKLLEKHFEIALETPDGITRLRELILKFAMQGKLVAQNMNDESSKELIGQLEKEKKELIKQSKFQKITEPISEPYKLPKNWEWVYLGNITLDIHYGYNASSNESIKSVRLLRITDIQNDKVDWELVPGCEINENQFSNYALKNGDILIARTGGTIGKSYLVSNLSHKAVFASYLIRLKKLPSSYPPYIKAYLKSQLYWSQLYTSSMGTGQPNVNGSALKKLIVPLPPLEEQKRIVEKIEELMLLCDQLEKQRDRKNNLVSKINNAAINKLVEANDEQSLNNAWLFIQHQFETIFSDKKNVVDLKEVILNLAMRGKLVTNNSNDVPASELIIEIVKEKKQLIKDKIITNQRELPAITTNEKKFNLPYGWEWVRLNDYGIWKSGSTPSRSNSLFYDGNIPWVKSGEVKQGKIKFTSETISELALEKCSLHINPIGSVLIAMYGANIGETGVLEIDAATNQAVCACKTYTPINNIFLYYLLLSLKSNFISQGAGAAQPNISREKIINTVVPLPPINEQKRIVEKIKNLFQLADLLESNIEESSKKQVQILNSVLAKI